MDSGCGGGDPCRPPTDTATELLPPPTGRRRPRGRRSAPEAHLAPAAADHPAPRPAIHGHLDRTYRRSRGRTPMVARWQPRQAQLAASTPAARRQPCTTTTSLASSPKRKRPTGKGPNPPHVDRIVSSPPPPSNARPRGRRSSRPRTHRSTRPVRSRPHHAGEQPHRRGPPRSHPQRDSAVDHVHQPAPQDARPWRRCRAPLARRAHRTNPQALPTTRSARSLLLRLQGSSARRRYRVPMRLSSGGGVRRWPVAFARWPEHEFERQS